jgi:hypothetical protein
MLVAVADEEVAMVVVESAMTGGGAFGGSASCFVARSHSHALGHFEDSSWGRINEFTESLPFTKQSRKFLIRTNI